MLTEIQIEKTLSNFGYRLTRLQIKTLLVKTDTTKRKIAVTEIMNTFKNIATKVSKVENIGSVIAVIVIDGITVILI